MVIVFRSQCGRRVGFQGVPQQLGERSPTCYQLQEWTARVGWGVAFLQAAGGECTRRVHLASLLKTFLAGPHTRTAASAGEAHYFTLHGTRAQQLAASAAGGCGKAAATAAATDSAHDAGATSSSGCARLSTHTTEARCPGGSIGTGWCTASYCCGYAAAACECQQQTSGQQ